MFRADELGKRRARSRALKSDINSRQLLCILS
jgi:hypothetical protein